MDIHENEEQIEELEPLEQAVEMAADRGGNEPVPADGEPLTPAAPDPLDDVDQEDLPDEVAVDDIVDEQPGLEIDPGSVLSEDLESLEDELEEDPPEEDAEEILIEDEPEVELENLGMEMAEDQEPPAAASPVFEANVLDKYADPYHEKKPVEPVHLDGRAWYVVHCYSGNEDKVRHNIMQRIESMSMDDLIFDVVVPTEDEVNIKNGERQTIEKKVFPGYILVNMILTEESWYMVRNTPGVTGFVGMGNDPTALQPEEVARILKRMESESPRINVTFRPGERVRIVDGPFEDFYGKVAEIDMERATVRVMVNFFGRETPVELDFLQVEEA